MDNPIQSITVSGHDSSMCRVLTDGFVCASINNTNSSTYHEVTDFWNERFRNYFVFDVRNITVIAVPYSRDWLVTSGGQL